MNYSIQLAVFEDSNQILEVLNTVTKYLLEQDIKQWDYPWKKEDLENDIMDKHIYILRTNHRIIGTFSLKEIKNENHPIMIDGNYYMYRIAILPEFQGKNIGKYIIDYAFKYVENKKCNLYLDCWSENRKLRQFYTKSGMKLIGDFPECDYYISIFEYKTNTKERTMIREATIKDKNIITSFNLNMALETEDLRLDPVKVEKGVENLLLDPSKGTYYVYEKDGKVVGQIMYTYEWSDWRNGNFLWIQSVYVDKQYRRKGIFKSLYKHVQTIAENDSSVCGLRLYVEKENHNAKKTYKSLGMDETHYLLFEWEK